MDRAVGRRLGLFGESAEQKQKKVDRSWSYRRKLATISMVKKDSTKVTKIQHQQKDNADIGQ